MKSQEIRRLANTWDRGDFPHHLSWIEIEGLRGWDGERIEFNFPIVAIVGENGVGKSTIIQAAASIYRSLSSTKKPYFASDFFPDTAFDTISGVSIRASIKRGLENLTTSVRKPTNRWRGNPERYQRNVEYLDLRRTQPIYAKHGYGRIGKSTTTETTYTEFTPNQLERFSKLVGKQYDSAKQSATDVSPDKLVPVVTLGANQYSGFHQGAGEATLADLITLNIADYSLVLIDEIETSLHPRAQRRLVRDLAKISRLKKVQFICTTHSPYILEELPIQARVSVLNSPIGKNVVHGVSPEFALSKMDEENHPEIDFYVEDKSAKTFVEELVAAMNLDQLQRIEVIPFGAASVGKSLGNMKKQSRFRNPTIVALDGDQDQSNGCILLPGGDAPERVVFRALLDNNVPEVANQINRSHSDLVDSMNDAITQPNHHEWIKSVADSIVIGGQELWRAMCKSYFKNIANPTDSQHVIDAIEDEFTK
jgi:predicted ATPase